MGMWSGCQLSLNVYPCSHQQYHRKERRTEGNSAPFAAFLLAVSFPFHSAAVWLRQRREGYLRPPPDPADL
jgi:hypothetical protein